MSKPTLLILAVGMRSRYGGLKQIDAVGPGGETITDYSIYDALRAGFGKLVSVIRRDIEQQFKEIVGARFEKLIAFEYVFQEVAALLAGYSVLEGRTKSGGTTHAILMAAHAIREPFVAITGDDFFGARFFRLRSQHLSSGSPDFAMVGFILRTRSPISAACRAEDCHPCAGREESPRGQGGRGVQSAGNEEKLIL